MRLSNVRKKEWEWQFFLAAVTSCFLMGEYWVSPNKKNKKIKTKDLLYTLTDVTCLGCVLEINLI